MFAFSKQKYQIKKNIYIQCTVSSQYMGQTEKQWRQITNQYNLNIYSTHNNQIFLIAFDSNDNKYTCRRFNQSTSIVTYSCAVYLKKLNAKIMGALPLNEQI
ncbi:hypothetical protein TTHERM_000977599 (macronuclear) [Tetrahymena thermophila SB210]|uniref:Uncharacterized protein n=1 Tax=Tetrahymena thermophila (strain SB210) TaxID=312017 RepID=W7WWD9_TETTS|nr:hypothetical protein TTHERM_000977599 [Tetrahymena thermophila SB210]EWS71145.1 hypothetical protein TTHERM_000977599 [Tetrahymena thermophila SB210]|eukprot:XP_012656319.1 hypothetical protein TTHERM_000977599 [Tetrahymena thermophila SB210]